MRIERRILGRIGLGFGMSIWLAAPPAVGGEALLQLELELGATVKSRGTKHHKTGSAECNPFGRDPKVEPFTYDDLYPKTKAGNGTHGVSGTFTYPLATRYKGGSYQPRRLEVVTSISREGEVETVRVELRDHLMTSRGDRKRGKCSNTNYQARAEQITTSGSLTLGYRMPAHTWAVRVHRSAFDGDLARRHTDSLVAAFNRSLDPVAGKDSLIVWAEPGSIVGQRFAYSDFVPGRPLQGSFSVRFEPLGNPERLRTDRQYLDALMKAAERIQQGGIEDYGEVEKLLDFMLGLIRDPDLFREFMDGNRSDDLFALGRALYRAANAASTAHDWHLKAVSALLAFEVGHRLLQDLAPFCSMTDVDLPFQREVVSVQGLRVAYYYLSRALLRLESYQLEHFEPLISRLGKHAAAGRSYADVVAEEAERNALRNAYRLLAATVQLDLTPFGAVLDELRFIRQRFRSIGAGAANTEELLSQLTALSQLEQDFHQSFAERMLLFTGANREPVKVADLSTALDSMRGARDEVIYNLRNNIRFLSLDDDATVTSFVDEITRLVIHNVEIFRTPSQYPPVESLRAAFVDPGEITQTLAAIQPCIDGVPQ